MDEETQRTREETERARIEEQRLVERRDIKRRRLHELEKQADFYGERDVPPHIEMERVQLDYELGVIETALNSPARAGIGDELGPAARFTVGLEGNRRLEAKVSFIGRRLDEFIDDSKAFRDMNRQVLLIIGIVVIIILVVVVAIITAIVVGGLPK